MLREFFIRVYLLLFGILFRGFKLLPVTNKTVFVASFGDNAEAIAEKVQQLTDSRIIFLKTLDCRKSFSQFSNAKVLLFSPRHLFSFLFSIYYLATSKKIFVDNYYGFLSATQFKKEVICIQLWHAAGAIKKFGLEDPSVQHRSEQAKKRFRLVYDRFDYVIIGSEIMGDIFQKSFALPRTRMLQTGIPRTDFFFQSHEIALARQQVEMTYPEMKGKKVILYAPTFRDGQLHSSPIALDIEKMFNNFRTDYILLVRLHPAVTAEFQPKYDGFLYDVTKYGEVNHLLAVADILITDYSSISFEYALLKRPMIFYAYDLESYKKERGFWEDYHSEMPGPVAGSTEEVIEAIKNDSFNKQEIENFAVKWNKYSDGNSSEKLVKRLY